uniref:Uncharacterized protein n=1 Tax=Timema shepardi TaxID=629360 RepID=A0A7R9B9F3_TIMSH|nr:unnamed protein product [Timema shepardi]
MSWQTVPSQKNVSSEVMAVSKVQVRYSSPVASLVLTDSSHLTSDSQHLGIYSSPVASLVLTDSSQLTSDSQHLDHMARRRDYIIWSGSFSKLLAVSCELSGSTKEAMGLLQLHKVSVRCYQPPQTI